MDVGYGKLVSENSIMEGNWLNGSLHGRCTVSYFYEEFSCTFDGMFVLGKNVGKGTLSCKHSGGSLLFFGEWDGPEKFEGVLGPNSGLC